MKFNENIPIYLQIKDQIENAIISQSIDEESKIDSIRDLAKHYQVNPQTISSAYNELLTQEILYKKRGIGMFVALGAREKLLKQKTDQFIQVDLQDILINGKKLGIKMKEVTNMVTKIYQGGE